jgi:TP901 family phage tail tape measure protein
MSNREIARLVITLEAQLKDLKAQLGTAGSETEKYAKKQGAVLKDLKKNWLLYSAAITGAVLAIKKLAMPFAEFSHKMHEVRTLTSVSAKAFQELNKAVIEMTRRVPQSAQELAAALYDIVSAGVEVGKVTQVLELSAKAAVAGVTDTKTAARAGLTVINAYGKSINDLESVYDVLFKTVKEGVLTFEDISSAIGTVLPVAVAANVEFEEIAASIAAMTKVGIDTNRATTSLRSGLIALKAPVGESKAAMDALGITWKGWIPTLKQIHEKGINLNQMREIIPDVHAGQAIIALSQNMDTLVTTMGAMEKAKGAMEAAFDIMRDSPINQVKQLANSFEELKIAFTSFFSPALLALIRLHTKEFQIFSMMAQGMAWETMRTYFEIAETLPKITDMEERRNYVFNRRAQVLAKIKELEDDIAKTPKAGLFDKIKPSDMFKSDVDEKKLKALREQAEMWRGELLKLADTVKTVQDKTEEDGTGLGAAIDKEAKIIETSLTVIEAQIKQTLSEIEMDYKNSEISTKEYYDSLASMAKFSTGKQIDALNDLLPQLEKLEDTEENRQRIKETSNKINALEIELQTTLTGLTDKHTDAMTKENKEYSEKVRVTEDLLKKMQSRVSSAGLPEQERETEELKQRQEEEKNTILENVKDTNEQKRYLLEAQAIWEREQTELTAKHERETREKTLTTLSDAFGKTSALFDRFYSDRLQVINNTEAAIANAERAGDEGSKERLKAQLKAQQDAARKQFYIAKSLALAEAIINAALAITKVYGQTGIYGALAMISVATANGLAIGTIMGEIIAGPGFAEGGMVDGPSGRDVIPARLTKNEFVQPTGAVDYYGTGVMEAIRKRSIPRELLTRYGSSSPRRSSYAFAEGGLATMPSGGERGEMALQINNIVSPALMGDYLTSRDGQSLVLNIISGNAYEIRRRIGI